MGLCNKACLRTGVHPETCFRYSGLPVETTRRRDKRASKTQARSILPKNILSVHHCHLKNLRGIVVLDGEGVIANLYLQTSIDDGC